MSDVVISIEGLSKQYRLGQFGGGTLKEDVSRAWARLRGRPDPYLRIGDTDHGNRRGEILWALRDINLDVQQGEIVGIIGRNGAGKSTLLKILSRTTAPTSGRVKVRGHIASLLEVGTGFHPDLTGRENVYLNGVILGMPKTEIDRKFDEIVAFSEIEQFLDTPVKRYSSGMFVRLAFAVAAHLEPEILLVDEVLAVGDTGFQHKCLGKMEDIAGEGRTVVFVSHNLGMISALCERCVLLSHGTVAATGECPEVVQNYLFSETNTDGCKSWVGSERPGDEHVRLSQIRITDDKGRTAAHVMQDSAIRVHLDYEVLKEQRELSFHVQLMDAGGTIAAHCADDYHRDSVNPVPAGHYRSSLLFRANMLGAGRYAINIGSAHPFVRVHFDEVSVLALTVERTGAQASRYSAAAWPGYFGPASFEWKTLPLTAEDAIPRTHAGTGADQQ
jgi:lipopolysaccharide transport system ATP-binding protein